MMRLLDYTRRAAEDRGEVFREGPASVTALMYFFWSEERAAAEWPRFQGALRETWRHCGRLKTAIVVNAAHECVKRFAAHHPWVEVQVEPTLVPGRLATMSIDCDLRLYARFATPYVLIVQDDGFPLREGLEEFLAPGYDYIGAPFVRHTTWFDWYPYPAWCVGNGGFSLRSRRICRAAARTYRRWFARLPYFWPLTGDDTFYCKTLRFLSARFRARFRFAPPDVAGRFSIEHNDAFMPADGPPLGFHSAAGWERWWARA
ncbi:MAG: DUF5672 family protein [Kiritimatiellia bacterium]